ncbi:protease complex subunit PrcB family protein [Beggiatoa alba]|nr:protease complex subunit PrcB family protein [Beggiatoa alba]
MNKSHPLQILPYFLLIACILLLTGCTSGSNSAGSFEDENEMGHYPDIDFKIFSTGSFSNISLPQQLVIRTKKDWLHFWKIHNDGQGLKRPKVNFDQNMVIAVFAGQQPSGGYSVGISHLKQHDENLYVMLSFTEPKPGELVSLALTQPYILISTENIDSKVIFLADLNARYN